MMLFETPLLPLPQMSSLIFFVNKHMFSWHLHCCFNLHNEHIDIVLLIARVCILVDFVITNPIQANLISRIIIFKVVVMTIAA
jgi:hypothetical protein